MDERILIAEDDATSRLILKALLEREGHNVVLAHDGNEAFRLMSQIDAPLVALLDWEMPGLSGPEVCEALRSEETSKRPYLIMLTARSAEADIVRGFEAGVDDYLTKPFVRSELQARVQAGLRILALQRQLATKIEELEGALAKVRTLEGIVPICMHCKRIRDSDNYWHQVEVYVAAHSEAVFSHGLCDECLKKYYPEDDEQEGPDDGDPSDLNEARRNGPEETHGGAQGSVIRKGPKDLP